MQINTHNLAAYGVSIEDMFNACKNIHVGSKILHESYQRALRINSEPGMALQIALSYYNTGSAHRGFKNGYVDKYIPSSQSVSEAVLSASSTISTQGLYSQSN